MKNLLKFSILFSLIMTVFFACKEELTKAPLDAPSSSNFYSSKDELQLAVNGAYNQTIWWKISGVPAQEQLDDMTDLGFERSNGDVEAIAQGAATTTNDVFEQTWSHFYSAIARVNKLLENMSRAEGDASEKFMKQIQAEARFLRAYSYLYLTELYGGVPLLKKVPTIKEAKKARTPKDKVVEQILSDLNFAAQTLPESWSGDNIGRATKGAALALEARVALYNKKYDVAVSTAQNVIDMGIYSLYPDYGEMFQYEGIHNSGIILDMPFKTGVMTQSLPRRHGSRNEGAWSQSVPSQILIDTYEATDGKPIDESSVYKPADPFENRDPRLDASIIRPQAIYDDFIFETHPDSAETWKIDEAGNRTVRMANQDVTNPYASFTGYLWRKYTDPEDYPGRIDASELNFILIRYAEVLLTYAEARIENNNIDQSVLDAINKVRARAYGVEPSQTSQYPAVTTTNQSKLRRIIRRERTVEFANEGFRLFDIRRWKIANDVMNGALIGRPKGAYTTIPNAPDINDENGHPNYEINKDLYRNVVPRNFDPEQDYLWAIPQDERNVNDQIEQNPGY